MSSRRSQLMVKLAQNANKSDDEYDDDNDDDNDDDPTFEIGKIDRSDSVQCFRKLLKQKLQALKKVSSDGSSSCSENEEATERYPGLASDSIEDGLQTISQISSPASVFACLMSSEDEAEPLNRNENSEMLSKENSMHLMPISNENESENDLNGIDEPDYIDEFEHHLADRGKLPFTVNEFLDSNVQCSRRNKRIWDKRDLCLYCYEEVTNFSRHLMRKHDSEMAVKQLLKMKLGSIERRNFIELLRKKGNFLAPSKKEIKLVKRSAKKVNPENVLACLYCKGYYIKRYLNKHLKRCTMRPDNTPLKNSSTAAQTYLATRTLDTDFYENLRLEDGVQKMRADKIALIAKSDPLIISFGSFYAKRHCHKHLHKVTRNKLREFARLWIELKSYINDKSLFESLKPENFKFFVLSVKVISGYDEYSQRFKKAPTLALHMSTNLMQLCDHAFSEIKQKNKVFIANINADEKAKEIKTLRELIKKNWNAELSSVACI